MAAGAQPQTWSGPSRRRGIRLALQIPISVTVLRSGIPDTLPGRLLNLAEGGIAAVLAGELLPGETVALEFSASTAAAPFRARALVRHHDKLRSGMEFIGLPAEQRATIRNWAQEKAAGESSAPAIRRNLGKGSVDNRSKNPPPPRRAGAAWISIFTLCVVALMMIWWRHWNRGWQALESDLQSGTPAEVRPKAQVPADAMQKLLIHRVEPEYPAAAREKNLEGVIILDVTVGRDGSVLSVHAQNGPDILARAAVNALRWWRFEPYRVNGEPVEVRTTMAVEFKP